MKSKLIRRVLFMENTITANSSKRTFLILGAALLAQFAASVLVSYAVFMPLADTDRLMSLMNVAGPTLFVLIVSMMITGIVLFIVWMAKRRFRPDNSMVTCIPRNNVFTTVYLNPTVVIFYGLCITAVVMELMNINFY
jgi:hypothetical protein